MDSFYYPKQEVVQYKPYNARMAVHIYKYRQREGGKWFHICTQYVRIRDVFNFIMYK